ncbi:MAG: hypothetical protein ABI867_29880 [Kofleriaceae bacterium]
MRTDPKQDLMTTMVVTPLFDPTAQRKWRWEDLEVPKAFAAGSHTLPTARARVHAPWHWLVLGCLLVAIAVVTVLALI